MADSTSDSGIVSLHVACPCCAYDLFGSVFGRCPECGLPTNEMLISDYQAGRRPARLEMPRRSLVLSLLQPCFWGSRPNLARDFPPDRARRFGRSIMGLGIAIYTLANTANLAFVVSNGGSWLPLRLDKAVTAPSSAILMLLPLFAALSCILAILAYALVRRSIVKRLQRSAGLSAGDAERVIAFTAIWQIPVSVAFQMMYPLMYFFPGGGAGPSGGAGAMLLLGGAASWKATQACISGLQGTASPRSPRSVAGRCADAVLMNWGYAWGVSAVMANAICGLHPTSMVSP